MTKQQTSAHSVTPGPDWTDIATTIRAIESTHSATLVLSVKADGSLFSGSVSVELVASIPQLVGPGQLRRFSLYSVWPSVKSKTFEGLVYRMLLELDHRIGNEAYKQAPLPFSPPVE